MAWLKFGIFCLTAALGIATAPHPVRAQALLSQAPPTQALHTYIDPIDQRPRDCYARPRAGGDPVLVRGRNDSSPRFWGYSTWDATGQPLIILNLSVLSQLPSIMTRFTFYHECAHLVLRTTDEVHASCEGVKLMRAKGDLAQGDELIVKREHQRLSLLGVKYLGTARRCGTHSSARVRGKSARPCAEYRIGNLMGIYERRCSDGRQVAGVAPLSHPAD
jgi:hypothetical protein